MKKIKKLSLNKEVVSILGGNDMNLVKGGMYSDVAGDSCQCGGGGYVPSFLCTETCIHTCGCGITDVCTGYYCNY